MTGLDVFQLDDMKPEWTLYQITDTIDRHCKYSVFKRFYHDASGKKPEISTLCRGSRIFRKLLGKFLEIPTGTYF